MAGIEIPNEYRENQDIPYKIHDAGASGDTIKVIDESGSQVAIHGQYNEDNDFPETIEGTIENADSEQYTVIFYGLSPPENPTNPVMMYDRELVQFTSNKATVLPPQEDSSSSQDSSNSSDSNDSKPNENNDLVKYALGATGLGGVLYYIHTR